MTTDHDLPEACYAFEESTQQVIGILRGEVGYRLLSNVPPHVAGNELEARAWIDNRNNSMGVTPAQREAMVSGSMFGWHLPIANPARHTNAKPYTSPSN
ncbi:hypothetical protein LJE71_11325 [Xanthobacter autotrophicus]|uniref:hypothetical protein n=1 Tax=Xanthobacter autotrophicus TaxID=280 RepID=UPI001E337CF9|nr:hypothetical protein [Xanthobacter autotrophicus]UDQ91541.1 hypothetical protein LJE71_11325 [Xanthobacter autotrophicus]